MAPSDRTQRDSPNVPEALRNAMEERARSVARAVAEACPPGRLSAVIAGGSWALGRPVWVEGPDGWRVFSDLDLFVVLRDDPRPEVVDDLRKAAERAWRAPSTIRWSGPPELGILSEADFLAQPSRPGTVVLKRFGVVLEGTRAVLDEASWCAERVSSEEGLRLLENRLAEAVLDGRRGESDPRWWAYRSYRLARDAGTALLVAAGRFSGDPDRDAETLEGWLEREKWDELGAWLRLGLGDPKETVADGTDRDAFGTSRRFTLRCWFRAVALAGGPSEGSAGRHMEWRVRTGRWRALREARITLRRLGEPRARALRWAFAVGGRSPRGVLALSGVATVMREEGGEPPRFLEGWIRCLLGSGADLDRALQAWMEVR
jgi:hypothetical protein